MPALRSCARRKNSAQNKRSMLLPSLTFSAPSVRSILRCSKRCVCVTTCESIRQQERTDRNAIDNSAARSRTQGRHFRGGEREANRASYGEGGLQRLGRGLGGL